MGRCWGWIAGGAAVLALSAAPANAQVRIGVGVLTPNVQVGVAIGQPVYVGPPVYVDRYYAPYYRPYRPVHVYRARPYYVRDHYYYVARHDKGYRKNIRRAEREYQRDVRQARREFERDIRDARGDRRRR